MIRRPQYFYILNQYCWFSSIKGPHLIVFSQHGI